MSGPGSNTRNEPQERAPWSVKVALGDVPETGQHFDVAADDSVRSAIAATAGVIAIPSLNASFDLARHGRGGLHVTGEVSAVVDQTCVVTLEPVRNEIREPVDLIFLPPDEAAERPAPSASDIDEHSLEMPDPPEVLTGGGVDLGAIAVEFLTLAIDPYPRKPGVAFDAPQTPTDPSDKPFAALAALKAPPRDKKR